MTKTGARNWKWGEWIRDRAQWVGYGNQSVMAAAVGCARQQVANWMAMPAPPVAMRKGFDSALAKILRTDRMTLFNGYRTVDPCDAPLIDGGHDPEVRVEVTRRRVVAVAELLPADQLRELARIGEAMLKGEPAHAA